MSNTPPPPPPPSADPGSPGDSSDKSKSKAKTTPNKSALSKKKKPQPKKSLAAPILISGLVGLGLGIGGTVVYGIVADNFSEEASSESTEVEEDQSAVDELEEETETEEETEAEEETTPESAADPTPDLEELLEQEPEYEPTVDDFTVSVSVKEQQCFGTAGCHTTLRTVPEYVGNELPTGKWEVTYEIYGVEDAPVINTFDVDGADVSFRDETRVSTETADDEVTATVTDVVEGF